MDKCPSCSVSQSNYRQVVEALKEIATAHFIAPTQWHVVSQQFQQMAQVALALATQDGRA